MALPRSASLSLWLGAVRRGLIGPDDFAQQVRGDDPQHLVAGWPDRDPFPLDLLPGLVRTLDPDAILVAVPAPGDAVGLAGPPAFNADALTAGEAVLFAGPPGTPALGLVPSEDARTVRWQAASALSPPLTDPGEAARALRQELVAATRTLTELDVASWQPEIPDLLLNLPHRDPLPLPPGLPPEVVDGLERADLCREIVELALTDHGGAVSAYEIDRRRACLTQLDHAARRAISALCSDSLGST